ncbi:hypothetical protein OG555_04510 [Kribbella sp. NBC_01484]|nr:hypothetical protein [Kribbella sp. NBC_01484]
MPIEAHALWIREPGRSDWLARIGVTLGESTIASATYERSL